MSAAITGDETGLLKRSVLATQRSWAQHKADTATGASPLVTTVPGVTQSRKHSITALSFAGEKENPRGRYVAVRRDGAVSRYSLAPVGAGVSVGRVEADCVGVERLASDRLLACSSSGVVRIWNPDEAAEAAEAAGEAAKRGKRKARAGAGAGSGSDSGKEEEVELSGSSFSIGSPLRVMRLNGLGTELASGGKESDLNVWDVETQKRTFEARNVPHDWLDERVPVNISDLHFVRSTEEADSSHHHIIATCTHYKQVRLYDTRADRRPVKSVDVGDSPWRSMGFAPGGSGEYGTLLLGDTTGTLSRLDLGKMLVIGAYPGAGGSLRRISVDPSGTYIASVSMDRCLRVHSVESRHMLHRVFLKQRLTALLYTDIATAFQGRRDDLGDHRAEAAREGDSDADSDFDALPTVGASDVEEDSDSDDEDDGAAAGAGAGAGAGVHEEDFDGFEVDSSSEEEEDDDEEDGDEDDEESSDGEEGDDSEAEEAEPTPEPPKRVTRSSKAEQKRRRRR